MITSITPSVPSPRLLFTQYILFLSFEAYQVFSQKFKFTSDFGNGWLQWLLPLKSTGKIIFAAVSYSTAVFYSSSLPKSVSQRSWGWKIFWDIICSVLPWSLDHLGGPSSDSLHYVPVSLTEEPRTGHSWLHEKAKFSVKSNSKRHMSDNEFNSGLFAGWI